MNIFLNENIIIIYYLHCPRQLIPETPCETPKVPELLLQQKGEKCQRWNK